MNLILSTELVLARISSLPPLPRAVLQLQQALQSEQVSTDRIVACVASDQALTIAALRLANSSFYGVSGRVATLRDAVQILGVHTLSAAVMTAAVAAQFNSASCPGFDFDACWRHAMATALCAQSLARARAADADLAYTAGLLHDVGRLALACHFPSHFAAALAHGAAHDIAPIDAERAVIGIDHAAVGAMVAAHWRLAPALVRVIGMHHDLQAGDGGVLFDLLHLADNIVHALDLSSEPDDMVPPLSLAVWERIGLGGPELQALFAHIETRMQEFGKVLAA